MTAESERWSALRGRFRELHEDGLFVMPNPWDIGSAKLLASFGFTALATTSSGLAAALGRHDQQVTLDELIQHASALVEAVDIPISVDAENCFADTANGVTRTIERIAGSGAAGLSIEDYHPSRGLYRLDEAVRRVEAAAGAAARHNLVLTARAENHLYGVDDLDDTIHRLLAYRRAGADVVYAPGLERDDAIGRVVAEVGGAVNVLLGRQVPPIGELADLGVRRVSTGGSLAFAAYGSMAEAARELSDAGTSTYIDGVLSPRDREAAFKPG